MLARKSFLALFPKPYYRTSAQRHIRCCSVLLVNQKEKSPFQPSRILTKWIKKRGVIENKFRNHFPRVADMVFRVRDGVMALLMDGKDMMLLQYGLSSKKRQIHDLNLRELELTHETYLQLKRMLPVIFIFAIPVLGNFIVAFLVYIKPLKFLTPHFWTQEQKDAFIKEEHVNKTSVFLPIIQYLDAKTPQNTKVGVKFLSILESIQRGSSPNFWELVECKELFNDHRTFSLEELPLQQLDNLLILHSQRGLIFKQFYLRHWASYLKLVDDNIKRSGGASKLSAERLRKYCFQRGVNANAMTEKEMCDYLNQWIKFSEQIPEVSLSLLIHAPAIIGFSHKSNLRVTRD